MRIQMPQLILALFIGLIASGAHAKSMQRKATPTPVAATPAPTPTDEASGDNPCYKLDDTKPIYNGTTHAFRGCRVTSVKTGSGYDKMGLKTGDIVDPESGKAKSMEVLSGTSQNN